MRKILITLFLLTLVTPAFAVDTVNWDATGVNVRKTFAADDVTASTKTQAVTIPSGAQYAGILIKSGTHGLESGNLVAGAIANATFGVNITSTVIHLKRMNEASLVDIPTYKLDTGGNAAWDQLPNISNYGFYLFPVAGAKFLNITYDVTGAAVQNTVIIDFNPRE